MLLASFCLAFANFAGPSITWDDLGYFLALAVGHTVGQIIGSLDRAIVPTRSGWQILDACYLDIAFEEGSFLFHMRSPVNRGGSI
jgi:hypothetical protein